MTQRDIYAFDCGTTNWRLYRLSCEQDANGWPPLSDPQRVALTTFKGSQLPTALLLDERNQVLSYGDNAYEQARDAEWRPSLRDAFKLCLGNLQSVDLLEPRRRYTHQEALDYTRLLLEKVINQLGREKHGSLENKSLFLFVHPIHWGKEQMNGLLEGEILPDFAAMVRSCFPEPPRDNVHFVTEPEAALQSLTQSGQLQKLGDKMTLVVDVGGGTTDFVAGCWTAAGLQDVRTYGEAHGGGLFDSDLAAYVAEMLRVPETQRAAVWTELCHYGRELKEALSRQMRMDESQPVAMKIMLEVNGENSAPTVLSQRLQFNQKEFEARTQKTAGSCQGSCRLYLIGL
ncbi:MAG: hypothetical protein U1F76_20790 [Candidatus Competibacteraceae bacterium]